MQLFVVYFVTVTIGTLTDTIRGMVDCYIFDECVWNIEYAVLGSLHKTLLTSSICHINCCIKRILQTCQWHLHCKPYLSFIDLTCWEVTIVQKSTAFIAFINFSYGRSIHLCIHSLAAKSKKASRKWF